MILHKQGEGNEKGNYLMCRGRNRVEMYSCNESGSDIFATSQNPLSNNPYE
jgi:hypothetical protein